MMIVPSVIKFVGQNVWAKNKENAELLCCKYNTCCSPLE